MSKFVDECRNEWKRLGVPESVSNEMAADLEADLGEAETEGVSPEEVLGNGVFDPRSFAASWAMARGVAVHAPRVLVRRRRSRWWLALGAGASVLAVFLGSLILAGNPGRATIKAVRIRPINLPPPGSGPRHFTFVVPAFPGPPVFGIRPLQAPIELIGLILLMVGLIGIGVTLWLWKPWSMRRSDTGIDDNVGLPSYL